MKPRWTRRKLEAAISAISAMLAGEEGKGDWPPEVRARDLEGAKTMLYQVLDTFPAAPQKSKRQTENPIRFQGSPPEVVAMFCPDCMIPWSRKPGRDCRQRERHTP